MRDLSPPEDKEHTPVLQEADEGRHASSWAHHYDGGRRVIW